ncbi:MAG: hypothetical protein IT536_03110 [Hyphomicrobiales bacterium]|nr:hypothetical protein [Hyphomicrobiales bacterium]
MPKNPSGVFEHLELLFKKLDAAKLAPQTILKSPAHKEHYETILMFAFRKLQAARYHLRQVEIHLGVKNKELKKLLKPAQSKKGELNIASATTSISMTANEFVYELSAFSASVRSAIDFLAMVCAQHLKGIEASSITTLLYVVDSGKTGPILNTIGNHTKRLHRIRDYRDFLVRRLVIGATAGGQIQWKHGKAVTTAYPVLVPSETPKHVPDTRLARAHHEPEHGFNVLTSEAVVTFADGSKKLLEHSVKITPAERLRARRGLDAT